MKKILEYGLGLICWLNALSCYAVEKFEVLPDLPDPLAAYAQTAEASAVSGTAGTESLVGGQSIGQEVSFISVIFALLITLSLFYLLIILYTKLNKANANILKKQQSGLKSQASVISTTALGNNKTLHVIELDGKRMLIGASSNAIQLIKDLGNATSEGVEEEFSHIEIPTIKIPKIEIPKIEIPTIGFSKLATKIHKEFGKEKSEESDEAGSDSVEQTENVENPDGIIDSLFAKPVQEEEQEENNTASEHVVDPDEYALYKKYLG